MGLSKYKNSILTSDDSVDIKSFINQYKNNTVELNKIIYGYGDLNNFDANKWKYLDIYINNTRTIDFEGFYDFIASKTMTKEDLDLIKCYVMDACINEDMRISSVYHKVRAVYYLAKITNFFSEDIVEINGYDVRLDKLIDENIPSSVDLSQAVDYLLFLEGIDYITDMQLLVLRYLQNNNYSKSSSNSARNLPSNSNILGFDFYLKKFFEEEESSLLRAFYMPVLIWWKVTNVIPMRASEITRKLERDCLINENGKFYLKINRVKVTNEDDENKKKKRKGSIPILKRVEITEDIYNLMNEYINLTSFDKNSKTFFSYKAWKRFLFEKSKKPSNRLEYENLDVEDIVNYGKQDDVFTRVNLQGIINSFYNEIIKGKYNDESITEQLKVGDTRHLAFCSLMLQGLTPIEIAMLGGHTSLEAQDHYVGHSKYYIDSEILNYISDKNNSVEINNKHIKNIIFSKKDTPGKSISKCFKTKDGVGYCTVDLDVDGLSCENKSSCIYCSKWWCMPTNENYIKVKEYLQHNKLSPLQQRLEQEENFLRGLLKKVKTVKVCDLTEIQKEDEEKIRSVSRKIKSTANEILFLKKSLLEIHNKNISKKNIKEGE